MSASSASILAVPSMNKSLNSNPLAPKSTESSAAGSIFPVIVAPPPTRIPPFAVTIPANAALPLAEIVAALPTFIFPLPPVLSTCISPTISSTFVLTLKSRLPSVASSPAAPTITMPCCVRSPVSYTHLTLPTILLV